MSAFCVYCCASPLFLSSVLMAHLNKVLDVSQASSTNLTYLFWDLFSFSFNLRWPRNKSLYFPLSFFSLIFLLGFRPLILPSFFHPVPSSNPSLWSLTRPSIHFPRTSPTHSLIHSSTPTSIFHPRIHLSSKPAINFPLMYSLAIHPSFYQSIHSSIYPSIHLAQVIFPFFLSLSFLRLFLLYLNDSFHPIFLSSNNPMSSPTFFLFC